MANEIISTEDSRQVTVGWTKLVTKAGDIVRHQKSNMKVPPAQTFPRDRPDFDTRQINIDDITHIEAFGTEDDGVDVPTYKLLALKLDRALREAKQKCLQCEMLVPCDLTIRVAQDIIRMSEYEPCGLRGCIVHLNIENKSCCRKLGKMKWDPESIATFELHLTLRQDNSGWFGLKQLVSSRLFKKVGREPAIVVHEGYTLSKKKLYRSSSLD